MTDTPPLNHPEPTTDAELEQLLTSRLVALPLSSQALERVRIAVGQAWQTAPAPRGSVRIQRGVWVWARWVGLAVAASMVAATLALITLRPAVEREQFGSLARDTGGGLEISKGLFRYHRLHVGEAVQVGDTVSARGSALVVLARGGTLRVGPGSVIAVVTASELTLKHGVIYVDKPLGLAEFGRLHVMTRAGLVEHVGTEFELKSDYQVVRIRVREGQVRYFGASGARLADAGTELLASSEGRVTSQPVSTFGPDWEWTTALAPEFAIEGRPLGEFLQWVSRELGRTVTFADARARESASSIILHGSIQDETPSEALANILATTSLAFELADGTVRIRSGK